MSGKAHITIEETSAVRTRVLALLDRRPDISRTDLETHTTLSQTAVHRFINSGEEHGLRVVQEFQRVLALIEAGDILQPRAAITTAVAPWRQRRARPARNFYRTQTVERVATVLNHCADNGVIGIATGEYGIGKTDAIRRWLAEDGRKHDVIVFEFDEFTAHQLIDFIWQLARRMNLEVIKTVRNGGVCFRAICDAINRRDRPLFLIFDQCESVSPRIMQAIRQIYDNTRDAGTGMALFASPLLLQKMNQSRTRDMGALSSRVAIWVQLDGTGREECTDILAKEGLTGLDASVVDLLWRASAGSMRRLMAAADLLLAKHKGKKITEHTVEGVAKSLWGFDLSGRAR